MRYKTIIVWVSMLFVLTDASSQQSEPAHTASVRDNMIQFSILPGSNKVGAALKYKSMYRLSGLMSLGWGAGLESYDASENKSFLPLTAEVIGHLSQRSNTPFYGLGVGYGIPLREDETFAESSRGGVTYNVSLGYRMRNQGAQPYVSIGYQAQHAKYYGEDQAGDDNKIVTYKRWCMTIGVAF